MLPLWCHSGKEDMLGAYSGTALLKAQQSGLIYIEMRCWELEIPSTSGMG